MQLPEAAGKVFREPSAQPCQFTQLFRRDVGQLSRWRPLLGSKPRDPQRIDRVGLGPLQSLSAKRRVRKGFSTATA